MNKLFTKEEMQMANKKKKKKLNFIRNLGNTIKIT